MCNQSALYQKKVDGWKGWEWGGYKRTKSCKEGLTSLSRYRMNNYYVKGVGSWPKKELGKYFNWKPDQKRITQILRIVA